MLVSLLHIDVDVEYKYVTVNQQAFSNMPSYKLYYFQAKARAENSRFIFKQAGIDFEDVRFEYDGEDWAKFKPKTPYGAMPVLEVDSKQLAGSRSIQRYLAEEFGLAGSNAWENAKLDSIVDVCDDLFECMAKVYFEEDEAKKTELGKKITEEDLPKYLGILEKLVSPDGWMFGIKVTYVDFVVYNVLDYGKKASGGVLDNFPALKKICEAVEALPNISKWLKERPESQF